MEGNGIQKLSNFLLRKEINDKKYEIMTYEKRKEKEMKNSGKSENNKWTVFTKQSY
jgi:diaminopimelate epimerase